MAAIMITGGSGFLGTYVTRELAGCGDRVINFDAVGPAPVLAELTAPFEQQIVFVRGQVLDLAGMLRAVQQHNVERIFHAAALYDPPYSLDEPAITWGHTALQRPQPKSSASPTIVRTASISWLYAIRRSMVTACAIQCTSSQWWRIVCAACPRALQQAVICVAIIPT